MEYARPHVVSPQVAAMLRQSRKARGWTLKQAQTETGVHYSHLSRLETGQVAPSTAVALDLAYGYGLNHDQARMLMAESVPGVGRSKPRKAKAAA